MGDPSGGPPAGGDVGRDVIGDTMRPPQSIQVSQDGVAFEVVLDGERILRLYADGRRNKGSEGVERKTKWDADKLVTEIKVAGGRGEVKVTETWALLAPVGPGTASSPSDGTAADSSPSDGAATRSSPSDGTATDSRPSPSRLAITTRLEGGPFEKAVVVRRVYDREPAP
jgi:hypothetical protein